MPRGWPTVYEARKHVPDLHTRDQFTRAMTRVLGATRDHPDVVKRRLGCLTVCESVLKFHFLFNDEDAQKMIVCVVKKFEGTPELAEYTRQFKELLGTHIENRVTARRAYIEFILKGPLGIDCARVVSGLV